MLIKNSAVNWDEFDPYIYLKQYYERILNPDRKILTALVKFYKKTCPKGKFLEIGCGPNLFPILAALPYAEQVDLVDICYKNISYMKQQLSGFHNIWLKWMDLLIKLDDIYNINFNQQLKKKAKVIIGNIFDLPDKVYDAASMNFVSESITNNINEFHIANRKFIGAIKPGGIFFATYMENSQGYDSPGRPFPAVAINTEDIIKSIGFLCTYLEIVKIKSKPGIVTTNHTGILVAMGTK